MRVSKRSSHNCPTSSSVPEARAAASAGAHAGAEGAAGGCGSDIGDGRCAAGSEGSRAAGEGTLLLRFGSAIDEATNKSALRRLAALGQKPRGVTDAVPAYASLAVHYDCTEISRDEVEAWVAEAAQDGFFSEQLKRAAVARGGFAPAGRGR